MRFCEEPWAAFALMEENGATLVIAGRPERPLNRGVAPRLGEAPPFSTCQSAFTLVEVMMGVLVMGVMLVSLYAGFTFGFEEVRLARENVRATQILAERMEVVRLINWDQVINLPGYIPTSFTAPFYADNPTNGASGGFNYTGTVTVTNAPISETYAPNLRMIKIQVSWPSGRVTRKRTMTTFVSQYGMQKYVY